MNKVIAVLASILVLGLVNFSIYHKERLISDGSEVLLELAPVDPRSLMQGDYMILRFTIANDIGAQLKKAQLNIEENLNQDGKVLVTIDNNQVANFKTLAANDNNIKNKSAMSLKYRIRNGQLKFATNAFFFEEGFASFYDKARYGVFKVASDGEMILVDVADESFKRIKQSLLVTKN